MPLKIKQIWYSINLVLSCINVFIALILLGGGGIPQKYKDRKIPLAANIVLLVVLVTILVCLMSTYGDNSHSSLSLYDG
jgi:hypothetical protein